MYAPRYVPKSRPPARGIATAWSHHTPTAIRETASGAQRDSAAAAGRPISRHALAASPQPDRLASLSNTSLTERSYRYTGSLDDLDESARFALT